MVESGASMEAAISIIIGGLITIATAMFVEYLRTPRLQLTIEHPVLDVAYPVGQRQADNARYLRLKLRNKSLPSIARWMQRSAALQCRGEITFHHLNDGQDVFDRVMAVRFVNSPEPLADQILDMDGNVRFQIRNWVRATIASRVDVYPGEEQLLDVAVRLDEEPDCYGWSDESYLYRWRNPNWRLPPARYLVRVVITSSGQKCIGVFRLINDVPLRTDFRLMPTIAGDPKI